MKRKLADNYIQQTPVEHIYVQAKDFLNWLFLLFNITSYVYVRTKIKIHSYESFSYQLLYDQLTIDPEFTWNTSKDQPTDWHSGL